MIKKYVCWVASCCVIFGNSISGGTADGSVVGCGPSWGFWVLWEFLAYRARAPYVGTSSVESMVIALCSRSLRSMNWYSSHSLLEYPTGYGASQRNRDPARCSGLLNRVSLSLPSPVLRERRNWDMGSRPAGGYFSLCFLCLVVDILLCLNLSVLLRLLLAHPPI